MKGSFHNGSLEWGELVDGNDLDSADRNGPRSVSTDDGASADASTGVSWVDVIVE